ncbi:MAG: phospho-N-acetylmuramoyl-pentapeptide-transferase [Dehalococcoidia bacterium]
MTHALLSGAAAFLIALVAGTQVVPWLRRRKLGKAISEEGPSSHLTKAGTPTMGGLLIFGTVVLVSLLSDPFEHPAVFLPLGVAAVALAIGAYDDLGTLVGGPQRKLSWRVKFVLLFGLSVAVACVLYFGMDRGSMHIPWAGVHDIGYAYLPIAIAIVFLMTPATAITDGLDGLLGGTAAVAYAAYGALALMQGDYYLGGFLFAMVGALLGFLWYNAHPAAVFMGDAGALPVGAVLATAALMTEHWLILPLIGLVFVIEAASTVIQIAHFKATGGRRLFRMTPVHHHFELIGWSEPQVVTRFWLLGGAAALAGVALALAV